MAENDWHIFKGDGRKPHKEIEKLNEKVPAPTWRGKNVPYLPTKEEIESVNASIYLRRPLLLTGSPGTGKSSLAKEIAREFDVDFIHWAINSKSTLEEGLYEYDAISRLQDVQSEDIKELQEYIKLGALGEAFAKGKKCVLLIDELDKSDVDLPNDLLHILEENEFEIPVLKRYKKETKVNLGTKDEPIMIEEGKHKISIENMPIIIITSNQEKDFSPAFMRRCLSHHIEFPQPKRLVEIACKHLEIGYKEEQKTEQQKAVESLVDEFMSKRNGTDEYKEKNELAIDQLLNALYLRLKGNEKIDFSKNSILNKTVLHNLEGN